MSKSSFKLVRVTKVGSGEVRLSLLGTKRTEDGAGFFFGVFGSIQFLLGITNLESDVRRDGVDRAEFKDHFLALLD